MSITRCRATFHDDRGSIMDIVQNEAFEHVTLIHSRAGARRGDHYHEHTLQIVFMLTGRILALTQQPDGPVIEETLQPGDLMRTPPLERHALIALEDSTFVVLTRGPRGGDAYETDTIRLDRPLGVGV